MRIILQFFSLLFLFGLNGLLAEQWVRGSAVVLEASGGVTIDVPAEDNSYEGFEQPVYFSGIFSVRAESDGSVLLHASNGVNFAYNGGGIFSVERFEGILGMGAENGNRLAETQSRMILSLRRGELLVDTSALTQDSKFVVETPVGRISCVKAILRIKIEHDYRSGIYDFTISSAEGIVRFTDLRRKVYTIYSGQRISGAGSYVAPAIEVGDQMEEIRESFEEFLATLNGLDFDAIDRAKLLSHSRALPGIVATDSFDLPNELSSAETKRPRVIEFSPRAENVTPFRAKIKPPSEYQADLF